MKKNVILFTIIVLVFGCYINLYNTNIVKATNKRDITPVEAHGNLHVDGIHIKDKNGKIFQLRGVSTHGIGLTSYYHKYVNQEAFEFMRDEWGINAVRLVRYTPNNDSDYLSYLNIEELVEQGVQYATNAGIYAIIDWHVLKPGNPNTYKSEAIEYFKEMATLFKDNANVLYEICNEPNSNQGEVTWEDDVKPYAEEVIEEIRKIDNDAIIIVGSSNWNHDIHIVADNPITKYDNLVYSHHFYAASRNEKYREKVRETLAKGLPLLISECGMVSANGNGEVDYESAEEWMKLLNENQIGYIVWQLTNKDEGSSLIKHDVTKLTGWTYEELSPHGQWLVNTLKKYENDNIKTYTIKFDSDGGNDISNQIVNENEKAIKPDNPIKEGYKFEGWYIDSSYSKEMDFEKEIVEDITLYAKWTKIENNEEKNTNENINKVIENKIEDKTNKIENTENTIKNVTNTSVNTENIVKKETDTNIENKTKNVLVINNEIENSIKEDSITTTKKLSKNDETISKSLIPYTGTNKIIMASISTLIVISIISYLKSRKIKI